MVQADVLLALAAKHRQDERTHLRLLKEIALVLESAAEQFEAVAELNPLRKCHYLLARTYHQLGQSEKRNVSAKRFRQISEFFDGSCRGQRSSWESLGLTPSKRPPDPTPDIDMPSSRPSFMPSTPPSWGAGSSPNCRVSARPAGVLGGGSGVPGSALVGSSFGEVSPFTYAFDAAEAAA